MDLDSLFKARGAFTDANEDVVEQAPAQEVLDPVAKLRSYSRDITKEIELGESIVEKQLVSLKQYREALVSLEASVQNIMAPNPLSILFELNGMEHLNMERLLNKMVLDYKIPYISLRSFKTKPEFIAMMPPDAGERLGIAIFGGLEDCVQVALLNPLRKNDMIGPLKEALKRDDIYFYLTRPEDISLFYDRLRKQLAEL